jgi:hypothetical protein
MELVWERIVLSYININWVLILWLFCGMVLLGINNNSNPQIKTDTSINDNN